MVNDQFKKHNAPTAIVVFGGTGDLAKTKLLPALLDLYVYGALPDSFVIVGLSRKDLSDTDYQTFVRSSIDQKNHNHPIEIVNTFCGHLRYVQGSFDDLDSYEKIKKTLKVFDDSIKQCTNKLFYLAVPPQHYDVIFDNLSQSDAMRLCDSVGSWSRLLVEKPFGKDLTTAQALEKKLCGLFLDEQIYRIDHYLAKDAIENIMSLRFANSILAHSWQTERIESIEVRMLETKDVSNRGAFYDGIGSLRDVGQNHMLQILALLLMAKVDVHDAQAVRLARTEALQAFAKQTVDKIIRGQYVGYKDTTGVSKDSTTETYFKLSFVINHEDWSGTKVTLEAGKALAESCNEAVITFRPTSMCNCSASEEPHQHKNVLRIQFSPNRKISLSMWTKKPGFSFKLQPQELVLVEEEVKTDDYSPEAYERVLFDCIAGDQTRFVSGAEVKAAWEFVTPILDTFNHLPLETYAPGSAGPVED